MSLTEPGMDAYHLPNFGTSPPMLLSPPNEEEVSTIFVIGFPEDFTEREFQNMFTFAFGYECAMLKRQDRKQLIGFAKFETRQQAEDARDHLIGRRVDNELGSVIKAEIAKKNLHAKKPVTQQQQQQLNHQLQMHLQAQMVPTSPPSSLPALQSPLGAGLPSVVPGNHLPGGHLPMLSQPASQQHALFVQQQQQQQQQQQRKPRTGGIAPGSGRPSEWPSFETSTSSSAFNIPDDLFAGSSSVSIPLTSPHSDRFPFERSSSLDEALDQYHSPSHRFFESGSGGSSSSLFGSSSQDHFHSSNLYGNSSASGNLSQSSTSPFESTKWGGAGVSGGTSSGSSTPFAPTSPTSPIPASSNVPYGGMGPPNAENAPCNTLYVGNLPPNTPAEELRNLFSNCAGYKRLSFQNKTNGAMCFVEFEDITYATHAMHRLHGMPLSTSTRGGIRLSYAKNSLGMRQSNSTTSPTSSYTPPPMYGGDAYGKHRLVAM